jgi:hypothetical protein
MYVIANSYLAGFLTILGVVLVSVSGIYPPALAQSAQLPPSVPSYGMNFQPESYWSCDAMYVDLMVHANKWSVPGAPSGYVMPTTYDGYPASLPVGNAACCIISTGGYKPGIYNFYGKGGFTPTFMQGKNYLVPGTFVNQNNITTCQLNLPASPVPAIPQPNGWFLLDIANIDPNNPPDDFHLIPAEYGEWPNVKQQFTNDFINGFGMFSTVRGWGMYGYTGPTWAPVYEQNWDDRPNPNWFGSSAASYENFVAYCNATKSDMWINIPIKATDNWLTGMANLIHSKLDPSLHVYIEPADECWNYAYPQWGLVEAWDQTNPVLDSSGWNRHNEEVAYLLMDYYAVMKPIVGGQARFVLAGQLANATNNCAPGLDWITRHYGEVNQYVYGIAMAPYVGPSNAVPVTDIDSLFLSMNAYITGTIAPQVQQWSQLAAEYKVKLLCYEAGQTLQAPSDPGATYSLYLAANLDPRMGDIHSTLATVLARSGVTLCNFNDHCDQWGETYWGLITNIQETLPGSNPSAPPKYSTCVNLAKQGTPNSARVTSRSGSTVNHHNVKRPARK